METKLGWERMEDRKPVSLEMGVSGVRKVLLLRMVAKSKILVSLSPCLHSQNRGRLNHVLAGVVVPKQWLAGVVVSKQWLAGVVVPKQWLAGVVVPKQWLAGVVVPKQWLAG